MAQKGAFLKGGRQTREFNNEGGATGQQKWDIEQKFKSHTQGKGYAEFRSVRYLLKCNRDNIMRNRLCRC